MDRADLDVAWLAAAFIPVTCGSHARTTQEPHRALEGGPVSEESVADALHQNEW